MDSEDGGEEEKPKDADEANEVDAALEEELEVKMAEGSRPSVSCPRGHGLSPYTTPHSGYTCDGGCRSALPVRTSTMSCRPCNYDVCQRCFTRLLREAHERAVAAMPKPKVKRPAWTAPTEEDELID